MSDLGRLIDILAATAEVCGTDMKPAALAIMAGDLSSYPLEQVEAALARVRAELKGRLTLAAILECMSDGRPDPDEAWAIALTSEDEAETVVWTREMAEAFSMAHPVLEMGDKVGARMAFKSAYERLVVESRASKAQAEWSVSLGWDADKREAVLMKAVERRLLPLSKVQHLLPAPDTEKGSAIAGLLTGKVSETSDKAFNVRLRELRASIVASQERAEKERIEKAEAALAADRERKAAVAKAVAEWESNHQGETV